MKSNLLYLDTYVLQQDMRIRLPKQIENNLNISKGDTYFDIFINTETSEIILRKSAKQREQAGNESHN